MSGSMRDMMGSGLSAGQASAINGSITLGATAAGATQATALLLSSTFTEVTTVAASTGVRLPAPTDALSPAAGDMFFVANQGANALAVYPPVGFAIGTAAVNTAVSVVAGKAAYFLAKGNGNFWAIVSA